MPQEFPPVPDCIKSVAHYLKLADDHESRNQVVTFYARMYAVQHAMKIIPGAKPPDVGKLLVAIMDHLERYKKEHADVDGITNETVGQALIEEYALKLHDYALLEDDNERFHKNMIKAFYTVGVLCDILTQFGDGQLGEDMAEKQAFCKQRAAYLHNCLKAGQKPTSSKTRVLMAHELDKDSTFAETEPDEQPAQDDTMDPHGVISWSKDFLAKHKGSDSDGGGNNNIGSVSGDDGVFELPQLPSVPSLSPPTPSPQPWAGVAAVGLPAQVVANGNTAQLKPEQLERAQKYCKWAASALNYEDVSTAIDNLQKALYLLQTGAEMQE